jgi:type I restriction enzyme S subunit
MFFKSSVMRSNYKQLGNYISQVDKRNNDLSISEPKGIRINKEFMPSVANTTGTDLSKYKVVSKGQFAYNPMHVGRDEVLPISLLLKSEPIIVSPAYTVFQVNDPQELDPEYLMMWCRRTEFDRNVWFTTDSSIRGGFSWDSFCAMELPVPSIKKQREIVKEYNTIVNRIRLNEQLNQKLEETAQGLYKHWFVDFEFPVSKKYAQSIGKPELEGKPYRSSGGEMKWSEELNKEIPVEWEARSFTKVVSLKGGGTPSTHNESFWSGEIPFFTPKDVSSSFYSVKTEKYITEVGIRNCSSKLYPKNTVFVTARGTVGEVSIAGCEMGMNQSCYAVLGCSKVNPFFAHQLTLETIKTLKEEAIGAVFKALVTKDFEGRKVIEPSEAVLKMFMVKVQPVYENILSRVNQNVRLEKLRGLILSKISKVEANQNLQLI